MGPVKWMAPERMIFILFFKRHLPDSIELRGDKRKFGESTDVFRFLFEGLCRESKNIQIVLPSCCVN